MKQILITLFFLSHITHSYSQDIKELAGKIRLLEQRINILEKEVTLLKESKPINANTSFEIKYEMESEDKTTDILVTYWDKEGKMTAGWFKSGWKYIFTTNDINQQIIIQARAGVNPKKPVTVRVLVNGKLIKSETKKAVQLDGPSCQVVLSEIKTD